MESCRIVNLAVGLFICKLKEFQPNTVLPCRDLPSSSSVCILIILSIFSYSSYYRYVGE